MRHHQQRPITKQQQQTQVLTIERTILEKPNNNTNNKIVPLIPTNNNNQKLREIWISKGLSSDFKMASTISLTEKFIFMASNLPYFIMLGWGIIHTFDDVSDDDLHWCKHPTAYLFISLFVSFASTVMHGAQLRLGHYLCCGHEQRTETFHRPQTQVILKYFDIFCAFCASCASMYCHVDYNVFLIFFIAVPIWLTSLACKRRGYYRLYLILHGLWHLCTSIPAMLAYPMF
jgi:hypothetical protein